MWESHIKYLRTILANVSWIAYQINMYLLLFSLSKFMLFKMLDV